MPVAIMGAMHAKPSENHCEMQSERAVERVFGAEWVEYGPNLVENESPVLTRVPEE